MRHCTLVVHLDRVLIRSTAMIWGENVFFPTYDAFARIEICTTVHDESCFADRRVVFALLIGSISTESKAIYRVHGTGCWWKISSSKCVSKSMWTNRFQPRKFSVLQQIEMFLSLQHDETWTWMDMCGRYRSFTLVGGVKWSGEGTTVIVCVHCQRKLCWLKPIIILSSEMIYAENDHFRFDDQRKHRHFLFDSIGDR